jgi:hypothetical protein
MGATIGVMREAAAVSRTPIMKRLLQSIENETRVRSARPAIGDATSEGVDDKGHVEQTKPSDESSLLW